VSWTNSKIFSAYITDVMNNTTAMDLMSDASLSVALYNDSIVPSQTATSANSAYGSGVWTAGSSPNVQDASGWPFAGRDLASRTITDNTATTFSFDAADTVSANDTTTLASVYGCLLYDNTITTPVADQGIAYFYFSGAQSVTSGRFTIVWNGAGIITIAA
jgi:hypothetical protein